MLLFCYILCLLLIHYTIGLTNSWLSSDVGFPLICILLVLSGILLLRHSFAKHYKNWASPLHGERRMKEASHLIIGYAE